MNSSKSTPQIGELPEDLKRKAINNVRMYGFKHHREASLERILQIPLSCAFAWSDTPEGGVFWSSINGGKYNFEPQTNDSYELY